MQAAKNSDKVADTAKTINKAADIPKVSNPKLNNYVNDFYKGVTNPNRVGSGTTADAIRFEKETGLEVFGNKHTQKGEDLARGLNNWLNKNSGASPEDIKAANTMLKEINDALNGN